VSKSVAVSSLLKVMIKGVDPRGDGDSCPTKNGVEGTLISMSPKVAACYAHLCIW